jgi:endonuclease YncB( thermonuclease family)
MKSHKFWIQCLVIASLTSGTTAFALPVELTGHVIYVDDGDTVILQLTSGLRVNVRLSDIDAPETSHGPDRPGQLFGQESKSSLWKMAYDRAASAHCFEQDKYGRQVCHLVVNGVNLNNEQVRAGMAWANASNPRFVRDQTVFSLQAQAKTERRGIWSQQTPTPPWVWRTECWKFKHCQGPSQ